MKNIREKVEKYIKEKFRKVETYSVFWTGWNDSIWKPAISSLETLELKSNKFVVVKLQNILVSKEHGYEHMRSNGFTVFKISKEKLEEIEDLRILGFKKTDVTLSIDKKSGVVDYMYKRPEDNGYKIIEEKYDLINMKSLSKEVYFRYKPGAVRPPI